LTVPTTVAVDCPMLVAEPVVAAGGVGAADAGAGLPADEMANANKPHATVTTAAAMRSVRNAASFRVRSVLT
jgi:hypothetical protein